VKTDFPFGRSGRRIEQGEEFLDDVLQYQIVFEEFSVMLRQAFEDDGVGEQFLPQADERADDIDAHRYRSRAPEDRRGHDGTVFGKDPREVASATVNL
jgi:hypothetical protein